MAMLGVVCIFREHVLVWWLLMICVAVCSRVNDKKANAESTHPDCVT